MSASAQGGTSNLVSVSEHLRLAPSYAAPPPNDSLSSPDPTTKPAPNPSSTSSITPFQPDELKQLVLDYLTTSCYVDSATAFARELAEASAQVDSSGGEGSGRPGSAEGVAGALDGARGGDGAAEAMEGVEATPEPFVGPDEVDGGLDGASVPVANGSGKNVAFLDDGTCEADDDADLPDCALLTKDDVRDLRIRRTIRDAILGGRITHAVDLLNDHFPFVLAPPSSSSSDPASSPSKLAPTHPLSPRQSRCTPQTFFVAPQPSPASTLVSPDPSPSPVPITGARFGAWALSLSPDILSLNLQTQAFIELMRTAHANSAVSTPSTPTSSVHGGLGGSATNGDAQSDADMSASTSSLGSSSILNVAIAQSQALREKVLKLPLGKEREGWEQESIDVCGLLAYKDLTTCPVKGYLAQSRREMMAEMVNAAILQHTRRTPLPLISLAARQATAFWTTLREMNVTFPPSAGSSNSKDGSNDKTKSPKTYPTFDLHSFLHEQTVPHSADANMAD
ncbi:lisH dimerization motif containing protein [Rhodotorula toruloides]|uniref:LisH dimerization motif containing protein n=1 Tax=Rhodotorula toruloides TaxID=5286 RepID=A0A511KI01_RHOTO|nr:lisH dimerization motif containing protein [Rhodotorula toruloides]